MVRPKKARAVKGPDVEVIEQTSAAAAPEAAPVEAQASTEDSVEESEAPQERMQAAPARAPAQSHSQSRHGYSGEPGPQNQQHNQHNQGNQGNQYDGDEEIELQPAHLGTHPMAAKRPLKNVDPNVTVTLSRQLVDRLQQTAKEEGIDMSFLISELLAEAVTLRAWEIIERKSQMRGSNQQQGGGNQGFRGGGGQGQGGGHNRNRGQHRGGGGGGGHGGGGGGQRRGQGGGQGGNAWMEDKAAFLEYVRNQEKRRR